MPYSAAAISDLFRQWASGNLDNIGSRGHVTAGLEGCTIGAGGVRTQTLLERFTSEDVSSALGKMMADGLTGLARSLICYYLLGWTAERIGRVLRHRDTSVTTTYLMTAEDAFVERLFNA